MKSKLVIVAAVLSLGFVGCSTNPGWMRRVSFVRNEYVVPVPVHTSEIKVACPLGWQLDPEGAPANLGSFIHPDHSLSRIVVSTYDDRLSSPMTPQAVLYAGAVAKHRRSEAKDLAEYRRLLEGGNPELKLPKVPLHNPLTYERLVTITLRDGRKVWICRIHSPLSGYDLTAQVPESGFVTNFRQPVGSSSESDLLPAISAAVLSYRCEQQ